MGPNTWKDPQVQNIPQMSELSSYKYFQYLTCTALYNAEMEAHTDTDTDADADTDTDADVDTDRYR